MAKAYEIFKHPLRPPVAVKAGFSWSGYRGIWAWAFWHQLWLPAFSLLALQTALGMVAYGVGRQHWILLTALQLLLHLVTGFKGASWRAKSLEMQGYHYLGAMAARDAADALAKFRIAGDELTEDMKVRVSLQIYAFVPRSLQQLLAVTMLTVKAAFRFRLFLALSALMLGAVVILPMIIKDDGSAQGLTQILLTYTLGAVTTLLGFATLWLSCGTLARDIEECQMQVVTVKPIPRWQIWLGKWVGLLVLNAMLLSLAGSAIYLLIQWRAQKLTGAQQAVLRSQVLVGRKSAKEPIPDYSKDVQLIFEKQRNRPELANLDPGFIRQQIEEQIKSRDQAVGPGYLRRWQLKLGSPAELKDRELFMRVKYHAAVVTMQTQYDVIFNVGPPGTPKVRSLKTRLAVDDFQELQLPANLFDDNGVLTIDFVNPNDSALIFPLDDGMEVLYQESGFAVNFFRGLFIIFLWLSLMAALGLAAASQLSFPVAAFMSIAMLVVSLSSGTLSTVVKEGAISGYDHDGKPAPVMFVDNLLVPVFKMLLNVLNLVEGFSPIDSLSTGRSVTWEQVGQASFQIGVIMAGALAVIGIVLFQRRELATAQGLH